MLLNAIQVWNPIRKSFNSKNLFITERGEIIEEPTDEQLPDDMEIYNLNDESTFLPGLFDTHIHGHGGFDFAQINDDENALKTILTAIGNTGVSYVMATLVSLSIPKLISILQTLDKYVATQPALGVPGLAQLAGIHLEGPFIAQKCKGAHDEGVLQDTISLEIFKDIIKHAPHIKEWKITLSPDLKGALTFIKEVQQLKDKGISVKVFLGHTNPKEKYIIGGTVFGAAGFTHLGNACEEKCSRTSAALKGDEFASELVKWVVKNPLTCPAGVELIVDGVHLSSHFVTYLHSKLSDKIVLVSDSLGPSGLEDGKYRLGTIKIIKEGNSFYIDDEGKSKEKKLAGSGASLADCIHTYWQWTKGIDIYKAAIENPRNSALSSKAISNLPDKQNGAFFNKEGKLVMSLCHGKINIHKPQLLSDYKVEVNKKKRLKIR